MPRLAEIKGREDIIAASVGGSVLFRKDKPERLDCDFVQQLITFCQEQLNNGRGIIVVVGGGYLARARIEDAQDCGVANSYTLDKIGIQVTRSNAHLLIDILKAHEFQVRLHDFGVKPGSDTIYIRGGTEPGHTTDYVAVQAAHEADITILLNIGSTAGLHPVTPSGFDESRVVGDLSFDEYLKLFPGEHTPGENIPFDREATLLAKEYGMAVILLGPDFENVRRCLAVEDFVGTILHP